MATLRQRTSPDSSPLDDNDADRQASGDGGGEAGAAPSAASQTSEPAVNKRWWQAWDPSLVLENKGSVARDHLGKCIIVDGHGTIDRTNVRCLHGMAANERTFLAWIRTSLSLITVGVAISQLFRLPYISNSDANQLPGRGTPTEGFRLPVTGKILGCLFIGLGMLFVLMAAWRFFRAQVAMTHGMFPTSRLLVILCALLILLLLVALMVVVLVERHAHT